MENLKIHICDDHEMIIDGLSHFLKDVSFIESINSSFSKKTLLTSLRKLPVDLLILDLNLDGKNMVSSI